MTPSVARVLFALVAVTLLTLGGLPGAVADSGEQVSAADLTLSDLEAGPDHPANAPDSVRAAGTYGQYSVKYLPTGLWVPEGDDSAMWRFLEPGTTVKRNSVQLWSVRGFGVDSKDVVIETAYWQRGTRTVQTENGSYQEAVAKNVTTQTTNATLAGGYDYVTVNLKPHYEERSRVTMCVRDAGDESCLANPTGQRWHFEHASSKAAQAVDISTRGGLLVWGLVLVGVFGGFTALSLFVTRKAIEQARSGPGISLLVWVLLGIGGLIGIVVFWDAVSNTLITAPWMLCIVGGILLGILAAEWFGDTSYIALFFRLRLADAVDPSAMVPEGGDRDDKGGAGDPLAPATDGGTDRMQPLDVDGVPGRLVADVIPRRLVRGDGTRSNVVRGFWKFIARFRGARADLEVEGNPQTHIDIEDGPYEELYFLDPAAENPMEYQPEGHRIEFPSLVDRDDKGRLNINFKAIVGGAFGLFVSHLAGVAFVDSSALGLLAGAALMFVWKVATPVPGHLRAKLAPAHYGSALATLMNLSESFGNARTWEDLFDSVVEEKQERKAETKRLDDRRSRKQVDKLVDQHFDAEAHRDTEAGDD